MIGLALEGGGTRGSYQAGAYIAFLECGVKIDGVCGTSIGALNGAVIASNKGSELPRIWHNSNMGSIFGFTKEYLDAIHEEFRVFKKLNMITFMLSMARIVNWCKENGIPIGPSRGSVAGSMIAYLCNITEVDPIRWHTIFSRFANENRLEIGD